MNRSQIIGIIILVVTVAVLGAAYLYKKESRIVAAKESIEGSQTKMSNLHPLSIESMRNKSYPGSPLKIEETLADGSNYHQYIASYLSDGLKIYGLLTVPLETEGQTKPKSGWPVIIFNHGYIPPAVYRTTERYVAYVDAFARDGYIVFKSDYRGNGSSEGKPEGAYYSPAYATDVLNAVATLKKYPDANPNKIGMWGHSMGGNITLRNLVVHPQDIKAAVIWGGVVGSYEELMHWHDPTYRPSPQEAALRNRYRNDMVKKYGTVEQNPAFWHSVDPTYYVADITTPIQLDHGEADEEVPVSFATSLKNKLQKAGKTVEYYIYPGADHNISQSFELAMQRSINFFDTYLKGGE